MQTTSSYAIMSLKLLDFEIDKFNRLYRSFIGEFEKTKNLKKFTFERHNKRSEIIIKFFPIDKAPTVVSVQELLQNNLIKKFIKIANNYFLMNSQLIEINASNLGTSITPSSNQIYLVNSSRAFARANEEAFAPPIISAR